MIGLLHEKGAEISAQDKAGDTPMHHALKGNKIESIRALASRGADIFKENGNRVSSAALSGMLDFVDEHTTAVRLMSWRPRGKRRGLASNECIAWLLL